MAFIIVKCQLFIPEMCIGVLTTFIQACSLNRKRKAHKITCLYPLEIPDLKPPQCLRNSNRKYLSMPSEIQFKEPPLPSEFQKAVRRTERIFSGIAQWTFSQNVFKMRACSRICDLMDIYMNIACAHLWVTHMSKEAAKMSWSASCSYCHTSKLMHDPKADLLAG